MRPKRRTGPPPELITKVNVTPIIDVALVLVIILIVTAPLLSTADLPVRLPELIEDQRSGLLVPAGDVAAFAAATDRLVRDEDLRRSLAAAGPERAAEFSVERMVRGTQGVYDSVLAATSQPGRGLM